MKKKIEKLLARLDEVEEIMGNPQVYDDQKRYRALTQEHSYLTQLRSLVRDQQRIEKELEENRAWVAQEKDPAFAQALRDDIVQMEEQLPLLQAKLENMLVPPDPNDHRATIIELRAGTGGDEAALFVGDCVRMYRMFADRMGWRTELLSCTESEIGGFKEYVMVLSGENVYRFLQHEAGTHRVQRVPATEAQGRVHTSAITIAVLHEPAEDEDVEIDEKDLRIDTYRSSGAGGQHVNKTDSAVRMTHIPTGIVVACQEERSQHKNRDKCLRLLKAKIVEVEKEKQAAAIASTRSMQVGSGDRSERIRTYNFPQNRITDHRINYTKHNLDRVMDGDLQELTAALVTYFYQEKLQGSDEA